MRSSAGQLTMAPSVKGGCELGAGQVGGYVEQYRGLTFATVRNAGHMVRHPAVPLRPCCANNW